MYVCIDGMRACMGVRSRYLSPPSFAASYKHMYIFVLCRNEEQYIVAAVPEVGCRNYIIVPGS